MISLNVNKFVQYWTRQWCIIHQNGKMDSQWIYVWLNIGPGLKIYGRSTMLTRSSNPLCCTQIVKRAISMITKHFYTILSLTHNNNHLLYTFLYHKVQNEFPYKLSKIRTHYTLFYAETTQSEDTHSFIENICWVYNLRG